MSEIFFVNIDIDLSAPGQIIGAKGKRKQVKLRRFSVSLPVRDKGRAEELMDHFAKGLANVFKEVEEHDQAQREAARKAGRDSGGAVPSGDDLKIVVDASGQVPGPGSDGGSPVALDLRTVSDSTGNSETEGEGT